MQTDLQSDQPSESANPAASWRGADLLVILYLIYLFWFPLAQVTLLSSGFYSWYYGPETVALTTADKARTEERRALVGVAAGSLAYQAEPLARQLRQQRMALWALALAFPLQVVSCIVFLTLFRSTKPAQLGLTVKNLQRNLQVGLGGWLILTPVVFAIHALSVYLFTIWPGGIQTHPLGLLAQQHLSLFEWGLWLFAAVVAAPVLEEILFRGILQSWFARSRFGGAWALALALLVTIANRGQAVIQNRSDPLALLATSLPILFVLSLSPLLVFVFKTSQSPYGTAIVGTAALFASVHSAWPTPIALFPLGLGLGVMARRSRSLVGPILAHALFNGVSAAQVLFLSVVQ